MTIYLRAAHDIREHFPQRVTEWIMTIIAMGGFSYALATEPNTFEVGRAFRILAQYGDEKFWSSICASVFIVRLVALVINGTFKDRFPYAPHMRAYASFLACIFWGFIVVGVLMAHINEGATLQAVVIYFVMFSLDMWNFLRAWVDVGAAGK